MTKVTRGKASLFHLLYPCNCPPIRKVRTETQAGQKLGGKSCCIDHEERCLLACSHGFLNLLSYTTQYHQSSHSELGPHTSTINQEKAARACPPANLLAAFSQLWFSLPK